MVMCGNKCLITEVIYDSYTKSEARRIKRNRKRIIKFALMILGNYLNDQII